MESCFQGLSGHHFSEIKGNYVYITLATISAPVNLNYFFAIKHLNFVITNMLL